MNTALPDCLNDHEVRDELLRALAPAAPGGDTLGIVGRRGLKVSKADLRAYIEAVPGGPSRSPYDVREAIVRQFARPSLIIRRDSFGLETFTDPDSQVWLERIETSRRKVEDAIRAVGRLDLYGFPGMDWVGTGWLVRENTVVTNRHVAQVFAHRAGEEFVFRKTVEGSRIRAAIDFRHEHLQDEDGSDFRCKRVLHIAEDDGPDLAFLEIFPTSSLGGNAPRPVPLADVEPATGRWVAAIGYPAWDGRRNDPIVMEQLFGNIFNCKRMAPGEVLGTSGDHFTHDCTTLGGNSGSMVIDLATGRVLGLHFAGAYLQANYAVPARVIAERLALITA
jgi:endonuclease G